MHDTKLPSARLESAVGELARLPGIGPRTALRLALHLLGQPRDQALRLGQALTSMVENARFCPICHNISEEGPCAICSDPQRDHTQVCVVEDIRDMMAIEATARYNGAYHVLGGVISPMNGIGPGDLSIALLRDRAEAGRVAELIFALPTTMEGDTTAYYIYRALEGRVPRISALARGIAFGDQLQYTDEVTLGNSISGRVPYKG